MGPRSGTGHAPTPSVRIGREAGKPPAAGRVGARSNRNGLEVPGGGMDMSPTTQRVLWSIFIALTFIVVAIVLSMLAPRILPILEELRESLGRARREVGERSRRFFADRWAAFWTARTNEPREPVVAELRQLGGAVSDIGGQQVRTMVALERRLGEHIAVLNKIGASTDIQGKPEQERIAKSVSGGSVTAIIFTVLLAVVFGAVNSFLLSVFFTETLPSYRLLPYPLPNIQAAHVLAILFFVLEVAIGWSIFRNSARAERTDQGAKRASGTNLVFTAIPWAMLVALLIVETIAYAVLSVRIDIPTALGLTATSAFYGIARYFLAIFGFCITGLLAYLGHAIAESIDEYRRARVERSIVRALEKGQKSSLTHAEAMRETAAQIRDTAAGMPTRIAEDFRDAVGPVAQGSSLPEMVQGAVVAAISASDPPAATALVPAGTAVPRFPAVRTRTQVLADLFVHTLLLAVLGTLAALTVLEVYEYAANLTPPLGPGLAWATALGVAAAIVMLGLAARSALRSLRFATPAAQAVPEPRGRAVFGWVIVALLGVTAALMALLSARVGVLGDSQTLNALLGLFQAGALVGLAGFLDAGLIAVGHIVYLAGLALVVVGAAVVIVLALIAAGLTYVVSVLLRILAVPGDVLRSRRTPVPTT